MAYTNAERVKIYRYLGFSPHLRNNDPRVELAIVATSPISDGGLWPDTTLEAQVRALLASLDALEVRRNDLTLIAEAGKADEVDVDPARAMALIHSERRRFIVELAVIFAFDPRDTLARVYGGAGAGYR